jgi:hypothetical protein
MLSPSERVVGFDIIARATMTLSSSLLSEVASGLDGPKQPHCWNKISGAAYESSHGQCVLIAVIELP